MSLPAENIAKLREAFYKRISAQNLKPLWEVLDALVPEHPQPRTVPVMWKYADLRPWLLEAGELISAKEATRRVLILENPGMSGNRALRIRSMPEFSCCVPARSPPRIGIPSRRCASSSKAKARSRPSTANVHTWNRAI